ncbi:MAG TPA: zinc-binding dehydrogenase, partial [Deinococcales bacterium]|nr:zinc-binding dehydrogenase [Deinococcales bacterium]
SDVHGFTGSTGRRKPGIVMGHETAGEVTQVGQAVTGIAPGDRVAVNPLINCGRCEACLSGRPNLCEERLGIGWSVDGAYAEFVKAPAKNLLPLPAALPFEEAALAEPLAVALRAASLTPFHLGETAVVIGAGPIGLLTVLALKLEGAGRVIVCDLSPRRLALSARLGADHTVDSSQADPVQAVLDLTGGRGAHAAIEAVGLPATADQSIVMVRNGGQVTWVGNSAPRVEIPMQSVVTREVTVRGSYGFAGEFERAVALLGSGKVDVAPLIELLAPLEDGPDLFQDLASGQRDLAKVIFQP